MKIIYVILLTSLSIFAMEPLDEHSRHIKKRWGYHDGDNLVAISLGLEFIRSSYCNGDHDNYQSIHRLSLRNVGKQILERIAIEHNDLAAQYALWSLYNKNIIDNPIRPQATRFYASFDLTSVAKSPAIYTKFHNVLELVLYICKIITKRE